MYNEEPNLFTKKEFEIWASYLSLFGGTTSGGGHLEQFKMDEVL
jgi:hypothetical protein